MRDKRSETRYEFKLNFKEITLFIVGSVGVISLFFIIGIWIGKSLNVIPDMRIEKEHMTESEIPEGDSADEREVDVMKADDTSYEFQDHLKNEKTIPLKADSKIKIIKKDDSKATQAKKIKSKSSSRSAEKSKEKAKSAEKIKEKSEQKKQPVKMATPKKGRYTVQIASLKNDKAALKLKSRLEKQGYDAYFVATNIKGKGVWYRVRVGNYVTKDAANRAIKGLEKKVKMKGMIVRDSRN